MRSPAHGYLIASIINDIIGPYARISNGRLYPLLASLEKAGLIAPYVDALHQSQGNRQYRSYQITEAGRKRFRELMTNTTSSPGEYQKLFTQKVAYLNFLKVADRLRLIDHYINYCQVHLNHLDAESEEVAHESASWNIPGEPYWVQDILDVMEHISEQWKLELAWAKSLREKELSRTSHESEEIPSTQRHSESEHHL